MTSQRSPQGSRHNNTESEHLPNSSALKLVMDVKVSVSVLWDLYGLSGVETPKR